MTDSRPSGTNSSRGKGQPRRPPTGNLTPRATPVTDSRPSGTNSSRGKRMPRRPPTGNSLPAQHPRPIPAPPGRTAAAARDSPEGAPTGNLLPAQRRIFTVRSVLPNSLPAPPKAQKGSRDTPLRARTSPAKCIPKRKRGRLPQSRRPLTYLPPQSDKRIKDTGNGTRYSPNLEASRFSSSSKSGASNSLRPPRLKRR